MKDRVVSTNPRRYELVSQAGTGVNGGALYDVYFASTPDVVGTPLKASVVLSDAVGNQFGLNAAQTDYTQIDFPSPNNAFRDVWKFLYPVGAIFEWIPIGGSSVDLSTPALVAAHFGGGTWARWGEGTFSAGYKLGDTDFGTVGATGGFKGIQQHTHTLNHGHTVETSGALTADLNTVGLSTSTVSNHTHTTPSHTHTTGTESQSHLHGYVHDHTTDSAGSHDHSVRSATINYTVGGNSVYVLSSTSSTYNGDTADAGSHTHDINNNTDVLTDAADRTHTHSITSSGGGTSGSSGGHDHTISPHTHSIPTHTHTISSSNYTTAINTSANGQTSAYTNGNLPPFTVSYKYVRTA